MSEISEGTVQTSTNTQPSEVPAAENKWKRGRANKELSVPTEKRTLLPDMYEDGDDEGLKILSSEKQSDGSIIEKIQDTKTDRSEKRRIRIIRTIKKSVHTFKVKKSVAERMQRKHVVFGKTKLSSSPGEKTILEPPASTVVAVQQIRTQSQSMRCANCGGNHFTVKCPNEKVISSTSAESQQSAMTKNNYYSGNVEFVLNVGNLPDGDVDFKRLHLVLSRFQPKKIFQRRMQNTAVCVSFDTREQALECMAARIVYYSSILSMYWSHRDRIREDQEREKRKQFFS